MRTIYLSALALPVLLLSACGGSGPVEPAASYTVQMGGEEVHRSEGIAELIAGRADQLRVALHGDLFQLTLATSGLPAEGVHPVVDDDRIAEGTFVFYEGGGSYVTDGESYHFGGPKSGTVTVDASTAQRIEGAFELTTDVFTTGVEGPVGEARVTGSFVATAD